jgi:hypothetical protein
VRALLPLLLISLAGCSLFGPAKPETSEHAKEVPKWAYAPMEECIEERGDWLEDGDVGHKGAIPKEPKEEHADEHGKDKKEEVVREIFGIFTIVNLAEHILLLS